MSIFDKIDYDWEKEWQGMPEFSHKDLEPWKSLTVHFECKEDLKEFAKLLDQKINETTKSIYFPKAEMRGMRYMRYIDSDEEER